MKPAARVGDPHVCPIVELFKPHGGGPIVPPGAPVVLIGNSAAARFADRATCIGPVDTIIKAASTVLVAGLPAARMTDSTVHGGIIVLGHPTTLIGEPSITGAQMATPGVLGFFKTETNTFVAYDPANNRMFIVSYLEYSGPNASAAYAAAAASQIEQMWGGAHTVRGKPTEVTVQVHTNVNTTGSPTDGYDQIEVDSATTRSTQELGGGSGDQNPNDANPGNYVAAHEYGHTLGLDDQYMDTPTGSVPDPAKTSNTTDNIMCQTWPDPATGNVPHPYEEHHNAILDHVGL